MSGTRVRAGLAFTLARLAMLSVSMAATLLVARNLGPERFGVLAAGSGVYLLVSSVGLLGADQLFLNRQLTSSQLRSLTPRFAAVTLAGGVILASAFPGLSTIERLVLAIISLAGYFELTRLPWLLAPQARGAFLTRAARETITRIATSAAMVACSFATASPLAVALSLLSANGVLTIGLRFSGWSSEQVERVPGSAMLGWLRRGAKFTTSSILYTLYTGLGLSVVAALLPTSQAALLRGASTILTVAYVVPVALNGEVLRVAIYRDQRAGARGSAMLQKYLVLNLAAAAAVTIVAVLVAAPLLALVLGPGYEGVQRIAALLALSIPLNYLNSFIGNVAVARGHVRAVVIVQALGVAFAAIVTTVLVDLLGVAGAPIGLVATELACLVSYALIYRKVQEPSKWVN